MPTSTHLKPLLVSDEHEPSRLVHTETRGASRRRDARQGAERVQVKRRQLQRGVSREETKPSQRRDFVELVDNGGAATVGTPCSAARVRVLNRRVGGGGCGGQRR